jgi:hypothetical protein
LRAHLCCLQVTTTCDCGKDAALSSGELRPDCGRGAALSSGELRPDCGRDADLSSGELRPVIVGGEPGGPSEASDPSEPSEPSEPGEPGEPSEPSEPNESSEPGVPGEPCQPSEPGEPGEPSEPSLSSPLFSSLLFSSLLSLVMCCLFLYNTHCIHNKEMSRKQMIVLYQTVEGTNFASGKQHELNQCGCDVNIAGWVATPPCTPPIAMLTGIPCVNLRNKFLSNVPPRKQKGKTTLKSGGGGGVMARNIKANHNWKSLAKYVRSTAMPNTNTWSVLYCLYICNFISLPCIGF